MESRKIQKVGYSTLTVSLPSDWVKQNKLNPGDLVFITTEKNGTLKISTNQKKTDNEIGEYVINVDACDEPGLLERLIVGNYMHGHDFMRISSQTRIGRKHTTEMRRIVRKLIGLGIVEETPKEILLQCSIEPTRFKLDILTRRLCTITLTILSEAMQAIIERDKSLAEEAIKREEEADSIYYLAVRLVLLAQVKPDIAEKIGVDNILVLPATRLILQYLELSADYSEDLSKTVVMLMNYKNKLPEKYVKQIYYIGESTGMILQKALECFFNRDIKCANKIIETKKNIELESNKLMDELPGIPHLRTIISTLNKIADKGATIAEIAINRALEEPEKYAKNIIQKVKHTR
ncbi:MAG: phosphate uptake regulator PhoU [Candidatus Parvarchaeota archaeon]|nr:phosphate uptake regulator PhoU [Candidatus Jingweiarchaeum tengchongense]MCW1298518.1 phosphate uptake regulator PhoU [Candidatus Jingweiarchaeum tengchongense]MCW1300236.1 phosphate uptake regulator PhoU [Candidatus Jingweiarchaeum tengchongense]MCW1304530.1 phosphate uptake regulator PhoU [Candidatus Jingweiarchaeum tengchongense]MCW1305742.1 phosphate uptake regulator PhoU [Candidatus Jingweiarchaeum tengchongense]